MSERPAEKTLRRALTARGDFPHVIRRIRLECARRGIDYDLEGGRRVPLNYMATPVLLYPGQVAFLHRLSCVINAMIRRMPALYLADARVREALPLPPDEDAWIRDCYRPGTRQPLVSRIDYDMVNDRRDTAETTVAYEANGTSIGGLYYLGAGPRMLADTTMGAPARRALAPVWDSCRDVARLMRAHARRLGLGRPLQAGVLDNRDWTEGITEMPRLAEALSAAGMPAEVGDPRDLGLDRGRLTLAGRPVDVLYRNMEVRDLADLEAAGARLDACREAFRRDAVLSGIAGDFDHKSLWEVLASRRTRHVVPRRWQALFRRHLLWTRLLRETRTEGPDDAEIDLVPYTRRNRETLVLKPNRACGGEGVTLGPRLDSRAWDKAIDAALADREAWVVQRFHAAVCKPFPVLERGRAVTRDAYICYGVVAADRNVGILGRACVRPVVNVAAGGGLLAVFVRD